jgi:hypothetical protein
VRRRAAGLPRWRAVGPREGRNLGYAGFQMAWLPGRASR